MKARINKIQIQIQQTNLLTASAAAIVNITDTNLTVSPALQAAAGTGIERATAEIGWCEIGESVVTDAGDLKTEKIIHAVAPRWGEGSERARLANLTLSCLQQAENNRLKSIAFPPISTGALGYPVENCAKTMIEQIIDFTFEHPRYLRTIFICVDTNATFVIFQNELAKQARELLSRGDGEVLV